MKAGYSVRLRVVDEDTIDKLLLAELISIKEHDAAVDFLRDLWRARMTGMAAVNLETTTVRYDPHRAIYSEGLIKISKLIEYIDWCLGSTARKLTVKILIDNLTPDPTTLELFRACLTAYRQFADQWKRTAPAA